MPKLKTNEKELSIKNIEAAIHSSLTIKDWDIRHLSNLLAWNSSNKYQKLCRILRNPENAKLGDLIDMMQKLDLKIEVQNKGNKK